MVDRRDRPWPVKDQGSRGTRVAFAGTASHDALGPAEGELSEDFLYWGSKQRDGLPADVDGTTLEAMGAALSDPTPARQHTEFRYRPGVEEARSSSDHAPRSR